MLVIDQNIIPSRLNNQIITLAMEAKVTKATQLKERARMKTKQTRLFAKYMETTSGASAPTIKPTRTRWAPHKQVKQKGQGGKYRDTTSHQI